MKERLLKMMAKLRRSLLIAAAYAAAGAAVFLVVTKLVMPAQDYRNAIQLLQSGKDAQALALLQDLDGFWDSEQQLKETRYRLAGRYRSQGAFADAYRQYAQIPGYQDTDRILAEDADIISAGIALRQAMAEAFSIPGSVVTFGTYPQKKHGHDDSPIEWIVLTVQDGRALLVTRRALECKPFHQDRRETCWADCSLRVWLNNEFLSRAFGDAEQQVLVLTDIHTPEGCYGIPGGDDTRDRVFLLSYEEAMQYFGSDGDRACYASPHANAQYAFRSVNGHCAWWLRSAGPSLLSAAVIGGYGYHDYCSVVSDDRAVRPAVWVDSAAAKKLMLSGS